DDSALRPAPRVQAPRHRAAEPRPRCLAARGLRGRRAARRPARERRRRAARRGAPPLPRVLLGGPGSRGPARPAAARAADGRGGGVGGGGAAGRGNLAAPPARGLSVGLAIAGVRVVLHVADALALVLEVRAVEALPAAVLALALRCRRPDVLRRRNLRHAV